MTIKTEIAQALSLEQLGLLLKGYEIREGQLQMAEGVLEAFEKDQVALIEAGTGTGKSLAYLIPALLWAKQTGERVVISTNTIALQEQLLHKDIPLALKLLKMSLPVVLAKGMGNYLCLNRLSSKINQGSIFAQDRTPLVQIAQATSSLRHGSKNDFPFQIPNDIWQEVRAENDSCLGSKCPEYGSCYFIQARKELEESSIVLVNHHLLFADLALRGDKCIQKTPCVLPPFSRLILDEGHHLEEIATAYFASTVEKSALLFDIKKINLATQALHQLLNRIENPDGDLQKIKSELETEWFLSKRVFQEELILLLSTLEEHLQNSTTTKKILLKKEILQTPFWKDLVLPKTKLLLDQSRKLEEFQLNLNKRFENHTAARSTESTRLELQTITSRLTTALVTLQTILSNDSQEDYVRWCECNGKNEYTDISFAQTPFDIAGTIRKNLFDKLPTCVISSATLTIKNSFSSLCEQIGISHKEDNVRMFQFESPFNYEQNTLFAIPTDLPSEQQSDTQLAETILKLITTCNGGAFVLFTSYQSLERCYQILQEPLTKLGLLPLKQGALSRSKIIEEFKKSGKAVLFGTDSFWEGVDVSGYALRMVIITKLPFQVPTDPLAIARSEYITKKGKNPFINYWLPKAIVKFKQGFGRLIRSKEDFGAVICLDTRLIEKGYGKLFIESIPKCTEVKTPLNQLTMTLESFYHSRRRGNV